MGCFHVIIVGCVSCRNDEAAKQSPRAINTLPTTTPTPAPGPCRGQERGCSSGTQLPLLDTQPDGCLAILARWLLRLSDSLGCLVTSLQYVCVCVCALLLLLTEFWFLVYHLIARPHAKPICRVAACGLRYSHHTTCCCPSSCLLPPLPLN